MGLFNKTLEGIKRSKQLKLGGEQLSVPYPFPRLNEYLTGIERGQAIGVLGPSGVGKSKLTRFMFLYNVYKFYKETGYKIKILFFCLEDSKDMTFNFVICNYLRDVHGIVINHKELTSRKGVLSDFVEEKLEEASEYFEEFENIVTFIDGETEPTKIYEICKSYALSVGKIYEWTEVVGKKEINQYRYESDVHVIAIFDNMSNIDTEEEANTEQAAILKFVKDYMRLKLCNFFKFTCVLVMQMDFESERQSFTRTGQTILGKIEPNLASIGDSKRSSRSLHLIFSLFDPSRHELITYPIPSKVDPDNCYRIDILGNKFRALKVIKSNYTEAGMRVGLMFEPFGETWEELPKPKTPEIMNLYKSLTKSKQINFENSGEKANFASEDDNETPF